MPAKHNHKKNNDDEFDPVELILRPSLKKEITEHILNAEEGEVHHDTWLFKEIADRNNFSKLGINTCTFQITIFGCFIFSLTMIITRRLRDSKGITLVAWQTSAALIGGGIVGTGAGDLISEIALAIEMGADAVDIGKTIHPHPTLAESVGMAAELYEGVCTDLPPVRKK